jgi:hypothetical protein
LPSIDLHGQHDFLIAYVNRDAKRREMNSTPYGHCWSSSFCPLGASSALSSIF